MTDIVSFGSDKPPWRPSRRLLVVVAAIVLVGAATAVYFRRGEPRPTAVPAGSPPPAAVVCPRASGADDPSAPAPAALLLGCAADSPPSALDRRDPGADRGPWTVVVRRNGGSLARDGAVITFPVPAPPLTARRVFVGRAPGRAGPDSIIWPIADSFARIRGDLPEADLVAIAIDTSVVAGRPATNPPAGFAVAGGGTYRALSIAEVRYSSVDVGESAALGAGLTTTAVARGGGFEDQLFATHAAAGPKIGWRPSVLTTTLGGNGAIVWEPAPGVVAYVGYSGSQLGESAAAALHRLAERARPLDDAGWRALHPTTIKQTNEPG